MDPLRAHEIDEAVYCDYCKMWLNGHAEWEDHKIGKKHKNNVNRRTGNEKKGAKDKGIVIPEGTAKMIEQSALLDDAVRTYVRSLYDRTTQVDIRQVALRLRL